MILYFFFSGADCALGDDVDCRCDHAHGPIIDGSATFFLGKHPCLFFQGKAYVKIPSVPNI
jgi:hypothetical protein